MKTDMAMMARLLEDVLPEGAYFILLVGEVQTDANEENCGFATDLAPSDATNMMREMLSTMEEQKR